MAFNQRLEISVSSASLLPEDAFIVDFESFQEEGMEVEESQNSQMADLVGQL